MEAVNIDDEDIRDRRVEKLHKQGLQPADIGYRVGLQADRVRDILTERGLLVPKNIERLHDGMWSADRDTLRRRIWERQRAGAKEALRAMRRQ